MLPEKVSSVFLQQYLRSLPLQEFDCKIWDFFRHDFSSTKYNRENCQDYELWFKNKNKKNFKFSEFSLLMKLLVRVALLLLVLSGPVAFKKGSNGVVFQRIKELLQSKILVKQLNLIRLTIVFRNRLKISLLMLSEFKRINYFLFPWKWSEDRIFSNDFRGKDRSELMRLNSLNIRSKIWRRPLTDQLSNIFVVFH